jgi:hypothetical protein
MSAISGNPEYIYSYGVLPPVTQFGTRVRRICAAGRARGDDQAREERSIIPPGGDQMRRRELVLLLVAVASWPIAGTRAQ